MSSTTEESDWEAKTIPQSRRPSANGTLPKKQQRPPPQPILPRTSGPGQSVFPIADTTNHFGPGSLLTQPFATPPAVPHPPPLQFVNQLPSALAPPSFITPPINPAIARVINENTSSYAPIINPLTGDVLQQTMPSNPMNLAPQQQYTTPPSRPVRGVRSGTGRARGRGTGSGTRKPRIKKEAPDPGDISVTNNTPNTATSATRGRGRGRGGTRGNRGGRPRGSRAGASSSLGIKRKRQQDEDEKDDSDVSEIITPLPTQSRSGRKISQAQNFSPVVIDLEGKFSKPLASASASASASAAAAAAAIIAKATPTTAAKADPTSTAATATPSTLAPTGSRSVVKKPRRTARTSAESSVCKNCTRGHSPASNMIVFCDGCNAPYHQHCHDPPIPPQIIAIESSEWFCADCTVLHEERGYVDGKVRAADTLGVVEKRRYLQSLKRDALVGLLLHATLLHPELPVFATPQGFPPKERQRRPVTHFVDPTLSIAEGDDNDDDDDDEEEDLYPDAENLPYPRAGNGVVLPPEDGFLGLLVDDGVEGKRGVYSHRFDWQLGLEPEPLRLETESEEEEGRRRRRPTVREVVEQAMKEVGVVSGAKRLSGKGDAPLEKGKQKVRKSVSPARKHFRRCAHRLLEGGMCYEEDYLLDSGEEEGEETPTNFPSHATPPPPPALFTASSAFNRRTCSFAFFGAFPPRFTLIQLVGLA
ncbi:MAG: hypothetical protein Q9212_003130 [Teloschistes hypoglaucus]